MPSLNWYFKKLIYIMKIILIKIFSLPLSFFLEQYEHRFSNKVKNNFIYTKAFLAHRTQQ